MKLEIGFSKQTSNIIDDINRETFTNLNAVTKYLAKCGSELDYR